MGEGIDITWEDPNGVYRCTLSCPIVYGSRSLSVKGYIAVDIAALQPLGLPPVDGSGGVLLSIIASMLPC